MEPNAERMWNIDIRKLEKIAGVKAHTIRAWESRYNFFIPERTSGNRRIYKIQEVELLLDLALLTRYGMPISKLDNMSADQRAIRIDHLMQTSAASEVALHKLLKAFFYGNIEVFEYLIEDYMKQFGSFLTFNGLIADFLDRTELYCSSNFNVIERLAVAIIRNKLAVVIDKTPNNYSGKTIALFRFERQYYELMLMLAAFLLKQDKNKVLYFGGNMSDTQLSHAIDQFKPDVLVAYVAPTEKINQKAYTNLANKIGDSRLVISSSPERAALSKNEVISYLEVVTAVQSK